MTTLFEFNVPMIEGIGGAFLRDAIADVYADIEQTVREELDKQAPGSNYEIYWDDDGLVVGLDDEQAEQEYGVPGSTVMNPAVRTALARAEQAMHARLEIRG